MSRCGEATALRAAECEEISDKDSSAPSWGCEPSVDEALADEDVEDEEARLMSGSSSPLLPEPRTGDWVEYALVDASCTPQTPNSLGYRLGEHPNFPTEDVWSLEVEECLKQMHLGEVKAFKGKVLAEPLRLHLLKHIQRHNLSAGATLDVESEHQNMKRASEGSVVFYSLDGVDARKLVESVESVDPADAVFQSLLLLKVSDRGTLTMRDDEGVRILVLQHISRQEDISPLSDGTLLKLSLDAPAGSFECARPGNTVAATVNDTARTWTWGYGEVDNDLEFGALAVGCGQTAEISRVSADGDRETFVLHVSHVGATLPEDSSDDVSIEEKCCTVAKKLFSTRNYLLARWHWVYVCDRLAPVAPDEEDEETTDELQVKQRAIAARACGNLAVVEGYLGRFDSAVEAAQKTMRLLPERSKRARDFVRLAAALEAASSLDLARDTCRAALRFADVSDAQRLAVRRILCNVAKKQKTALAEERSFCARIFA